MAASTTRILHCMSQIADVQEHHHHAQHHAQSQLQPANHSPSTCDEHSVQLPRIVAPRLEEDVQPLRFSLPPLFLLQESRELPNVSSVEYTIYSLFAFVMSLGHRKTLQRLPSIGEEVGLTSGGFSEKRRTPILRIAGTPESPTISSLVNLRSIVRTPSKVSRGQ